MKALLFFSLLSVSLSAVIHETAHFAQLSDYVDRETIVLTDIDDTLIYPDQMLGSDTWFEYRLNKYQARGSSFGEALEKTLAEWEAIRHLSRMKLVEPDIGEVIQTLQQEGVQIMGLTVQGLALATRTVLQLNELQIDLKQGSGWDEDLCLSVAGHTILFRHGILFTSGESKGESFFRFCEKRGILPKRIVMIDDKLSHLESVEKEAARRGIEFVGLRYSFSDERKGTFDPRAADYQLSHSTLTHLISDDEALQNSLD